MTREISKLGLEIVAMCTSGYARKLPDDLAKIVAAAIDERIAIIVRAAVEDEREACAKIADDFDVGDRTSSMQMQSSTAIEIAARIRGRA